MRRRTALAVAAAAAAALVSAPPSRAEVFPVTLTVNGDGNTTASYLVLDEDMLLPEPPTFFGSGSYLGAVVERVYPDYALIAAALRARALGGQPIWHHADRRLAPGRYVVHLLSDRPGRVSWAMSGQQGYPFATTTKVPMRVTTASEQLDVGVTDLQLRLPGGVPVGRSALLARQVSGYRAEQTWSCVTFQPSCPAEPFEPVEGLGDAEPPVTVPSTGDDAALTHAARSAEARHALVGVHGVRAKSAALRGLLLVYGR